MSDWLDGAPSRRDGVTIPTIWVAIALSLLVHIAVLWKWLPHIRFPSLDTPERGEGRGSLVVQLAPPPAPAPTPPSTPVMPSLPPPTPTARPPNAARPQPTPPVIALNRPAPAFSAPPPAAPTVAAQAPGPPAAAPAPARPPAVGDLAAYVEARRRARAELAPDASPNDSQSAPPADDAAARSNRIIAGNLGSQRRQTFGYDPRQGGGMFQITSIGYNNAEFIFFGWNKEIRRNTKQYIEVSRGTNTDIRIVVVRKMIAIIREYTQDDFVWESLRLERNIVLSARARDNAGLEDFMMREFFFERLNP